MANKTSSTNDKSPEILHTKLEAMAEKAATHHEYAPKNHRKNYPHSYITNKIKTERYNETISQAQPELSAADRFFSKVIHNNFIYELSELVGKTIARPITILISAVLSLIIGVAIMFWGKRIGFDYPNTIFVIIFCISYPLSLVTDLIISAIKKPKKVS